MKKKNLSLDALHVQSFVTSIESNEQSALKGGNQSVDCSFVNRITSCLIPHTDTCVASLIC